MKVGVTGATGFLGRHIVGELIAHGHEVVAWSRDPEQARQHDWTNVHAAKLTWVIGELGVREHAEHLARVCDTIVHAARFSRAPAFIGGEGDPVDYFEKNVIGTVKLLEASIQHQVERFVFVSSGAVHQRVAADLPLDERHPLWPESIYGASKASIETIIHAYGFSNRLDCCTVRPTSIYGVDDPPRQSKWFDLIQQVIAGDRVDARGGGKVVHAADVAAAIGMILRTGNQISGETFNLCERLISHFEVARIVKEITGSSAEIRGPKKISTTVMSVEKIKRLGVRFGQNGLLRRTIAELVDRVS